MRNMGNIKYKDLKKQNAFLVKLPEIKTCLVKLNNTVN